MAEFSDHLMALDGVEGGAKVNEEESSRIPGGLKVLKEEVEKACPSILCPPFGLVGKLVRVQLWPDDWMKDGQHQFFQTFHEYGCKCDWPVMVEF